MTETATYPIKWNDYKSADSLRLIKEVGFEAICIKMDIFSDSPSIKIDEYYNSGLRIENAHLDSRGTSKIWTPGVAGEEIAQKYIDQFKRCREYGIKIGIAHVTWGERAVHPTSPVGLERFRRIIDAAEKNDVKVAFENSVYPGHLRYVLDNIDSPYAGFCFDSGHRNAFSPDEDYFADYSERLYAMHMQDNDGRRDLHLIPFDGCADWPSIISDISKTELYKRCVILETSGFPKRECPGMSAEEIRRDLSRVAIVDDSHLTEIRDGYFAFYQNLSFEEYIERIHNAAMRIAGRV